MSFPRYEKYKDSGVDWLGEVPEGWEVFHLRRLFEICKRIAGEEGHEVLSITQKGIRIKDVDSGDGQLSMDYSKYQLVEPGDFAMNHMDLLTGYVDISLYSGVTSPDYRVFRLLNSHEHHGQYFLYLFQNAYKQKIFFPFGQGSAQLGRWRLPTDEFKAFCLPVPSIDEQRTIATFLDHETAKIDALVSEQEKLIELLKEKRQAVISHAVTKGLDPNVKMKDSGVEWLGDVPEGWVVCALKRIADFRSGESITSEDIETEGIYPVFGGNGLRGFTENYTHEGTYVLIGRQGALCGNINYASDKFWASEHAIVVSPRLELQPFWFGEMLRTMNLNQYSISAAQPGLSVETICNLFAPIPPLHEQQAIATFLDHETAKIDTLIEEAQKAIELMKERRTALISAAVTGKIDVRGYRPAEETEGA